MRALTSDAIELLRTGSCVMYGRHEAAKTCDTCIRIDAAIKVVEALVCAADHELLAHVATAQRMRAELAALEREWAGSWNLALSSPCWRYRPDAPLAEISAAKVRADAAIGPAMRRLAQLIRGER